MAGIKFVHTEETEVKLTGIPKIPFNKSKKLSSMTDGKTLYYINTELAFRMKLENFVDLTQKHPQDSSYAVITVPIERI